RLAADVEAVHPRQHHVENDQIVAAAGGAGEARFAVARGLDAIAFAAEPIGEREPQPGLVLHDQHAWRHAHDAALALPRRRPTAERRRPSAVSEADVAGRTTVTVVPVPSRLST